MESPTERTRTKGLKPDVISSSFKRSVMKFKISNEIDNIKLKLHWLCSSVIDWLSGLQSLFNHMLGRKVIFVIKLCIIHALKWKLNWLSWFNNLELHILNPNAALPKSEIEFFEIVIVSVNVITCSPHWDQYNHSFDLLIVLVISKCLERGANRLPCCFLRPALTQIKWFCPPWLI